MQAPVRFFINRTKKGTDWDAALLAISAIIQSYRSPAEVAQLVAFLGNDLADNGILDDVEIGSELVYGAAILQTDVVRANLEERYADLGTSADLGDFEFYVDNFLAQTEFEPAAGFEYPENGSDGPDVLYPGTTRYTGGHYNSLAANVPKGASLRVVVRRVSDEARWAVPISHSGWTPTDYDDNTGEQEFSVAEGPMEADVGFSLMVPGGTAEIDVYENGALTPTWTKTIEW